MEYELEKVGWTIVSSKLEFFLRKKEKEKVNEMGIGNACIIIFLITIYNNVLHGEPDKLLIGHLLHAPSSHMPVNLNQSPSIFFCLFSPSTKLALIAIISKHTGRCIVGQQIYKYNKI